MRNFAVVMVAGIVIMVLVVIIGTPRGSERAFSSMETAGAWLLAIVTVVAVILSTGWAVGFAARNWFEHQTPTETVTRVVERHTIDGRVPHAPQIVTVPGMFDRYPAEFGQVIEGQRADALHQIEQPAAAVSMAETVDLERFFAPTEW